jgi:hypothetical protein
VLASPRKKHEDQISLIELASRKSIVPGESVNQSYYLRGIDQPRIDTAVANLDDWFETVRSPEGYGGPVAHWWQQSLMYTGAGLDWRYEGIILGYLALWERTGSPNWLERAIRAGDDLIQGQDRDGHFRCSGFEINPCRGGTPHEAACDIGLLGLAKRLKAAGDERWRKYLDTALANLEAFYIGQLWDDDTQSFGDSIRDNAFVPNKAATASEAMFLLSDLTGNEEWIERYALPTLRRLLQFQVSSGDGLKGAIAQNSIGARRVEKYFPIYIARCIPALIRAHTFSGDVVFLDAAVKAMLFIERWTGEDGSVPTVVYRDKRVSSTPSWIAPLGDVLRAADELEPFGHHSSVSRIANRILDGQDRTGGIQTSRAFAAQAFGKDSSVPDARDLLHVSGWCDKAFRWLATHASPSVQSSGESLPFENECVFRGKRFQMVETREMLEFIGDGNSGYRWRKGVPAPEFASEEFWLR